MIDSQKKKNSMHLCASEEIRNLSFGDNKSDCQN